MPRYPVRPWWHPLQFMASAPTAYPIVGIVLITGSMFPFRYKIANYWERQRDTMSQPTKSKAIKQYRELERMYKREALFRLPLAQEDNPGARNQIQQQQTSFQIGVTDAEVHYWRSHQHDVMRAAKLQDEIKELKAKGVVMPENA
jgi:hypothetical protein